MSSVPTYSPSDEFVKNAQVQGLDTYRAMCERAAADPDKFWSELARRELAWFQPFSKGLEWNPPFAKWFAGGKINASYNCLDRHLKAGHGAQPAIVFDGEPGDERL